MAAVGYSGTPLAKKLGIRDADVLALLDAPPSWSVPDLPPGVEVTRTAKALRAANVTIAFCRTPSDLHAIAGLAPTLPATSALWVAWPRKAGGHTSEVSENLLREVLLPIGIVDVKVAAIDADWSGLKFVWRKENR
jgi:hypothetical protein